jgi:tetratricopeptide (TPR) repeat protein
MLKNTLILFFILLHGNAWTQAVPRSLVDSLINASRQASQDTSRIRLWNEVSFLHFTINPDTGIRWGKQALQQAEKIGWDQGIAGAYHAIGSNYWAKNDFLSAQDYYWKCLQINERLNDQPGIAKSYHDIAMVYEAHFNLPKAIEYYQNAYHVHKQLGNLFSQLGLLANIANVYEIQQWYPEALHYFDSARTLAVQYGNPRHVAYMEGRIGHVHTLMGNYDTALSYSSRALTVMERYPNKNDVAELLSLMAEAYERRGQHREALLTHQRALSLAHEVNNDWAMGLYPVIETRMGRQYVQLAAKSARKPEREHFLRMGQQHLQTAVVLASERSDLSTLSEAFGLRGRADSLAGDFRSALKHYRLHIAYRDSLKTTERIKEMSRYEVEHAFSRREDSLATVYAMEQSKLENIAQDRQIATLKVKQRWLFSSLGFGLLLLVGIILFFRSRTKAIKLGNELLIQKADREISEMEFEKKINEVTFAAIRAQMNPHFIFNALNTIQSYVYANDRRTAGTHLVTFSRLMRMILEQSRHTLIPLEDEVELLQLYLELEKARFGESLSVSIDIDPRLDDGGYQLPPMLVQPYLENAIKHGLMHVDGEKRLTVSFQLTDQDRSIQVTIDDSGIGREKSRAINEARTGHRSFSTDANAQRLDMLNKMLGQSARVEIIDKYDDHRSPSGTTVVITLPAMISQHQFV